MVPRTDADARAEIARLRAELERRTEAWRDALRLVSEAEARCLLLEDMLAGIAPVETATDAEVDWAGLRSSEICWSQR